VTESTNREIESKLVIVSDHAERLWLEIANFIKIAGFDLLPLEEQTIHDRYFDTDNADLARADLALRIRRVDSRTEIGLKGKSRKLDTGAIERLEAEYPWSFDGFMLVIRALYQHGIKLPAPSRFDADRAEATLTDQGLKTIQERTTHRLPRQIVAQNGQGAALGELALDHVTYRYRSRDIHHYELEVEAKSADAYPGLHVIVDALRTEYPDITLPWDHSKVATGKAIEYFDEHGDSEKLLDAQGGLTRESYNRIDRLLREKLKCP